MTAAGTSTRLEKFGPALDRVRIGRLYVQQAIERLPFSAETNEPRLLLGIATMIIGLALVLVRANHVPVTSLDEQYLAVDAVSMQAFALPPVPTAAPPEAKTVRTARSQITHVVFPTSRMSRSQGVRAVLSTAQSLIGKPYRWGATGPNAFDCSGFTSFVWRAAGLYLPHSSVAQYNSLPRVSLSSLQPGDIVFSRWNGGGHVGLYIGGGRMINAPQTGRHVEISPIRGATVGAVRPALLLREDDGLQG